MVSVDWERDRPLIPHDTGESAAWTARKDKGLAATERKERIKELLHLAHFAAVSLFSIPRPHLQAADARTRRGAVGMLEHVREA